VIPARTTVIIANDNWSTPAHCAHRCSVMLCLFFLTLVTPSIHAMEHFQIEPELDMDDIQEFIEQRISHQVEERAQRHVRARVKNKIEASIDQIIYDNVVEEIVTEKIETDNLNTLPAS
jgi:hypothetical protein